VQAAVPSVLVFHGHGPVERRIGQVRRASAVIALLKYGSLPFNRLERLEGTGIPCPPQWDIVEHGGERINGDGGADPSRAQGQVITMTIRQ
jgi:hypothetical protein